MIEGEIILVSSIRLKSRKVHESLTTREPPCSRDKKTEPGMTLGIRDNNSILSIDLNQDEDEIIIERDSPGYSSFQCLSDIGTSLLWTIGPYTMAHTMSLYRQSYPLSFESILWHLDDTKKGEPLGWFLDSQSPQFWNRWNHFITPTKDLVLVKSVCSFTFSITITLFIRIN